MPADKGAHEGAGINLVKMRLVDPKLAIRPLLATPAPLSFYSQPYYHWVLQADSGEGSIQTPDVTDSLLLLRQFLEFLQILFLDVAQGVLEVGRLEDWVDFVLARFHFALAEDLDEFVDVCQAVHVLLLVCLDDVLDGYVVALGGHVFEFGGEGADSPCLFPILLSLLLRLRPLNLPRRHHPLLPHPHQLHSLIVHLPKLLSLLQPLAEVENALLALLDAFHLVGEGVVDAVEFAA